MRDIYRLILWVWSFCVQNFIFLLLTHYVVNVWGNLFDLWRVYISFSHFAYIIEILHTVHLWYSNDAPNEKQDYLINFVSSDIIAGQLDIQSTEPRHLKQQAGKVVETCQKITKNLLWATSAILNLKKRKLKYMGLIWQCSMRVCWKFLTKSLQVNRL